MGLLDDAIREHLELKRLRGADPGEVARMEREALGPGRRPEPGLDPLADPLLDPEDESDAAASAAPFDAEHPELRPADGGADLSDDPVGGLPDETGTPAPASAGESPPDVQDFEEQVDPAHDPWAQSEAPPAPTTAPPQTSPPYSQETVQYDVESGLVDMPGADAPAEQGESAEAERPTPDPVAAAPASPDEPGPYVEVVPATTEAGAAPEDIADRPAPTPADHAAPHGTVEGEVPDEPAVPPAEASEEEDVLEETPDFLQETPEHERLWFEQRPPRDFDFDK